MTPEPIKLIPKPGKTRVARGGVRKAMEKRESDRRRMHENRPCPLCDHHVQAKEVEKAYRRWWPIQEIAEFFGYKKHVIRAHAEAMGWTKDRAESTPELYVRIMDEMVEHLDASKIPQKNLIEAIIKLGRHQDRLQGKIINRHELKEDKTVVFLSVPLPGGAPPLLPDKEALKLGPAPVVVDAKWEEVPVEPSKESGN